MKVQIFWYPQRTRLAGSTGFLIIFTVQYFHIRGTNYPHLYIQMLPRKYSITFSFRYMRHVLGQSRSNHFIPITWNVMFPSSQKTTKIVSENMTRLFSISAQNLTDYFQYQPKTAQVISSICNSDSPGLRIIEIHTVASCRSSRIR